MVSPPAVGHSPAGSPTKRRAEARPGGRRWPITQVCTRANRQSHPERHGLAARGRGPVGRGVDRQQRLQQRDPSAAPGVQRQPLGNLRPAAAVDAYHLDIAAEHVTTAQHLPGRLPADHQTQSRHGLRMRERPNPRQWARGATVATPTVTRCRFVRYVAHWGPSQWCSERQIPRQPVLCRCHWWCGRGVARAVRRVAASSR